MSRERSGKSSNKKAAEEETVMEMTPMIDVTFLLLVFFLCTIRFKTLEGKIPAYLPKEVGVNPDPVEDKLEALDLTVERVVAVNTDPRVNPNWTWRASQVRLKLNAREVPFADLASLLERARSGQPDVRVILRPGVGSRYVDAVKVLNECLRAKVTNVTFEGTPADA